MKIRLLTALYGEKMKNIKQTKKRDKKGQMKMQQMAFMLVAVTMFFAIAGLFVISLLFSNLKQSSSLLQEKNALLLVSKIADSPEFSCSSAFGQARTNCIDTDKVMALEGRIQDYSSFWGISGLEIIKVGNESQGVECISSNYPDCSQITLLASTNGTGVSNFVSMCRREQDNNSSLAYYKCELGKVIVTYNS